MTGRLSLHTRLPHILVKSVIAHSHPAEFQSLTAGQTLVFYPALPRGTYLTYVSSSLEMNSHQFQLPAGGSYRLTVQLCFVSLDPPTSPEDDEPRGIVVHDLDSADLSERFSSNNDIVAAAVQRRYC